MSLTYGEPNYSSLVYSVLLKEEKFINVSKKNMERKFNNNLKLLANEILFLTKYVKLNSKPVRVIYIGAAPGVHLSKLLPLFPFLSFDLYDPEDIDSSTMDYIKSTPSHDIRVFKEKFTIETCSRYDDTEDIYLITDHRDVMYNKEPIFDLSNGGDLMLLKHEYQMKKEESYSRDMELQREICKVLKPIYANLRFRPPHYYESGLFISPEPAIFKYFSGDIWLLIYNELKGTESRIVVNDFDKEFTWNYKSYQYRLNYFNSMVRESLLKNPFTNDNIPLPNQLGNKYEIIMLFLILKDYFISIGYQTPRVSDVINLYTDFIIKESCTQDICTFQSSDITDSLNDIPDVNDIDEELFEF